MIIEFCDYCNKSLTKIIYVIDEKGGVTEKRVLLPSANQEEHISIDHVAFCSLKCYELYWKDRKIYAPLSVKAKWKELGLFQKDKETKK